MQYYGQPWYTVTMEHDDIKEVVSSLVFAALMGFMVVVLFSVPRGIFF